MNALRTYASPDAFKTALEQRLKSKGGADIARRRQLLVFDRFLARVVETFGERVTLKGGLALELRLERARTTNDVDLRMTGSPDGLLERLQASGQRDLGDFMRFEVERNKDHPEIIGEAAKYDGLRFRASCKLAGKLYGSPFGVDVAFADPMIGPPDELVADDVLGFVGIAPPTLRVYPVETHLAEKLHAYTVPKESNSRVKDLPDIALLASAKSIDAKTLRAALVQTFSSRDTHALPPSVPPPPDTWEKPYDAIAREAALSWKTLRDVTTAAQTFLDPVLARELDAMWNAKEWRWEPA